jgi:hypothetical protein
MLNNANTTAPEDVEAEVLVAPNVNIERMWGDARNSTATLPWEDAAQQRGGKRRSVKMSGIQGMLRALKKDAAAESLSPPVVDTAKNAITIITSINRPFCYCRRRFYELAAHCGIAFGDIISVYPDNSGAAPVYCIVAASAQSRVPQTDIIEKAKSFLRTTEEPKWYEVCYE